MANEISDDEFLGRGAAPVVTDDEFMGRAPTVDMSATRRQADAVFESPTPDPKVGPKPAPTFDESVQKVFGTPPVAPVEAPETDPNRDDVSLYRRGGNTLPGPVASSDKSVLPKQSRRSLMDAYATGNVPSARDWYNRASAEVLAADDEAKEREMRREVMTEAAKTYPPGQSPGPLSEFVINQVTGLVAAVPGVATGIYNAMKKGDVFEFTEAFQKTQEYLTYHPKTPGGKKLLGAMEWIMENLSKLGEYMADNIEGPGGIGRAVVGERMPKGKAEVPPEVQALVYTSIAGAPLLLGLKQALTSKPTAADPRADIISKHGDAIEPGLPNPGEFADAATILAGAEPGSTAVIAGKLRNIYIETGRRPADVIADAERDPVLKQQLVADGEPIPTAYKLMVEPDIDLVAPDVGVVAKRGEMNLAENMPETVPTDIAWRMKDRDRNVDPSSTDLPALTESIKQEGIKEPITVTVSTADGLAYITDGNNRLAAARELGLKDVPIRIETTDVPFTLEQKAKAIPLDELGWTPESLPSKQKTAEQLEAEAWIKEQVGTDMVLAPLDEGGAGGGKPPGGRPPAVADGEGGPVGPKRDYENVERAMNEGDPVEATLARIGEEKQSRLTLADAYRQVYEDLNPIRRDVEAAKAAGKRVPAEADPYILLRNSRGSGLAAEVQIDRGPRNILTGERTGPRGLKEILSDAEKLGGKAKLDEFRAVAIAARDLEKLAQGVKTGGNEPTAKAVIEQHGAKYAGLFRELVDYQNAVADNLVRAGILSPESAAQIGAKNQMYVPFYRLVDEGIVGGARKGQVKNPIKEMTGSEAQLVDPILSIIRNTYLFQDLAMRNMARQKYVALDRVLPGIAEEIPASAARELAVNDRTALIEAGVSPELFQQLNAFANEKLTAGKSELLVYENGRGRIYKVDRDIAEAFSGSSVPVQDIFTKIVSAPARWLHAGVTLSPDFILKNAIRDPIDVWIKGSVNPAAPLISIARDILPKSETFDQWAMNGGGMGALVSLDRDFLSRKVHQLNADTGMVTRAWNVVNTPMDVLRLISERGDQMIRLAAYRKAINEGKSPTEAVYISREAPVDYARRGASPLMQILRPMVPFFNVAVQAPERMVRAMKDDPAGMSARVALMAAASVALYEYNRKEDWFKELSPFERDMYWTFKVGDYPIKLPKVQDSGLIFGSGLERIVEAAHEHKVDGMADWSKQLYEQLVPSPVPQIIRPVMEGHFGFETRFGRPLVPEYLMQQLPPYQYTESTSEIAKELGQAIGSLPSAKALGINLGNTQLASPIVLENYLRQWTGSLGQNALKLVDQIGQRSGALPEKYPAEMKLADVPFVKAFVVRYPSANSESIQRFEERYSEKLKLQNTVAAQQKLNPQQALELQITSVEDTIRLRGIKEALANQRATIQRVNAKPYTALSKEEKAQIIESTYYQMIQLSRAGNLIYDNIEKALKNQAPDE